VPMRGIVNSVPLVERPLLRGMSHAYAFWFAVLAASTLVVMAPGGQTRLAASVYGAGLCALFGGSALYHRWRGSPRWRAALQRVDHSTIFVFIAASYTPIGLLVLSGPLRWIVLITVWTGALAGVALSVAWIHAPRPLAAACYVALGWVAVLAAPQLIHKLPTAPMVLLVAGGVLYSLGAVIYAWQRPDPWPRIFGFHEIFHVFVILAAVAHFVALAGWVVLPHASA
jgi:hemolysin III